MKGSRFTNAALLNLYVKLLFLAAVVTSTYFCFAYISNPILEAHGFRQTQTALSAYYFLKDGFRLAYWTPVVGERWSIPFEFPFYQYMTALMASGMPDRLTEIGRATSWIFMVGSCVPINLLLRELDFPVRTRLICLALVVSSPTYLFWGSTFMIESTALFFSLFFAYYFVKQANGPTSCRGYLWAGLFLVAALLQKATTGLPVAMVASAYLLATSRYAEVVQVRKLFYGLVSIGVPLIVAYAWIRYSDQVKMQNPIGQYLTSAALKAWNYGTLEDRYSFKLWRRVIWDRIAAQNLAGVGGMLIVALGFVLSDNRSRKAIVACMGVMFVSLMGFTNLHIVHDYYQTAIIVFPLLALGICIAAIGERFFALKPWIFFLLLTFVAHSHATQFRHGYMKQRVAGHETPRVRTLLSVAGFVRGNTSPEDVVVWYGFGCSSEPAFYSQRKSLSLPSWGNLEDDALENNAKYLSSSPAAIVSCPRSYLGSREQLMRTAFEISRTEVIEDCSVFFVKGLKR